MVGEAMLWAVGNVRISVAELVRGWPIVVLCQSVATSAVNPLPLSVQPVQDGRKSRSRWRDSCDGSKQNSLWLPDPESG